MTKFSSTKNNKNKNKKKTKKTFIKKLKTTDYCSELNVAKKESTFLKTRSSCWIIMFK